MTRRRIDRERPDGEGPGPEPERRRRIERAPDENPWSRRGRNGRVRDAAPAPDAPDDEAPSKTDRVRTVRPGANGNSLAKPGRPLGSTDLIPRSIKALIKQAMELLGSDGAGKDGALGYMTALARNHPHLFVSLIRRTLPVTLKADLDADGLAARLMQTIAAQRQLLTNGNGRVIDVTPEPDDARPPPWTK